MLFLQGNLFNFILKHDTAYCWMGKLFGKPVSDSSLSKELHGLGKYQHSFFCLVAIVSTLTNALDH